MGTYKTLKKVEQTQLEKEFVPPWKPGTLIRVSTTNERGLAAFCPDGINRDTRTITLKPGIPVMFLGVRDYGPPTRIQGGENSNNKVLSNIVMIILNGEKKYLIRVHQGWTYKQFEEVKDDEA